MTMSGCRALEAGVGHPLVLVSDGLLVKLTADHARSTGPGQPRSVGRARSEEWTAITTAPATPAADGTPFHAPEIVVQAADLHDRTTRIITTKTRGAAPRRPGRPTACPVPGAVRPPARRCRRWGAAGCNRAALPGSRSWPPGRRAGRTRDCADCSPRSGARPP